MKTKIIKFKRRHQVKIARRNRHQKLIHKAMVRLGGYRNMRWDQYIFRIYHKIEKRLQIIIKSKIQ